MRHGASMLSARDDAPGVADKVLVGLLGSGIGASRTPAMHEREGKEHGLTYIYRLLDLDEFGPLASDLSQILTSARLFGFSGLNVTYPCKTTVVPFLDELSPEAQTLGAVNTIVFRHGRSIGHNTDCSGFAESFRRKLTDAPRERIVQFGAGGAGAAVAYALLTLGAGQISIVDLDAARAQQLARQLCETFGTGRAKAGSSVDLLTAQGVVNTTPVGMAKHPGAPFDVTLLQARQWISDIIYFPMETELLRAARARGCRTMGGGWMAVFQAVDAFRLFTGKTADPDRMLRHFEQM
jgi:shikimate dehydrogenase